MALPAIVGAAQVIERPHDGVDLLDRRGPIELMLDAVRDAATDAGSPSLLRRVGWIGVAGGFWEYRDPGRLIADQIGAPGAATALTAMSGSGPQELVGMAATKIQAGEIDVALVVGGEARWTAARLEREGLKPRWTSGPGVGEPEIVSKMDPAFREEMPMVGTPAAAYAILGDALRAADRMGVEAYRDRIAALWERCSDVAATNPFAWDRARHSAREIREATPANRMIAFPYTKSMAANNTVDMASAVLLCGDDLAVAAGVSRDRLVFPIAVTLSRETWKLSERAELHDAPGLRVGGRRAFELANTSAAEMVHVDLYACFPSIVELSARSLEFDIDRPLTVTGGLGFAGAAIGNAAGQSIAAMVPLVREGGAGFVHANGGHATKHAFGVYRNTPPDHFAMERCAVELGARAELDADFAGAVTVEAATVVYDREGPTHLLAAVRARDGRRTWARSTAEDVMVEATTHGVARRAAHRDADGSLTF